MVAGVVGVSPASATADSRSTTRFVSGSGALHGVQLAQTSLEGVTAGASGLDASIDWGQLATVTTQFDTDAVRQGRAVDPVNTVTRPTGGAVTANWNVGDLTVATPLFPFVLDVGNTGFSSTGACDIKFSGGPYVCHLESDPQSIGDPIDSVGRYVEVKLVADITVTPAALATLRTASIGGATVGTADLGLTETSTADPLSASCTAGVGDHLSYGLGALSSTPGVHVQANLQVDTGNIVDNTDANDPNPLQRVRLAAPSFPFAGYDTTLALSGTGITVDLGAVQADDSPITAVAGGPYTGVEGSPITFDGSASTFGCGNAAYHWEFSDGGSADGVHPTHTFADNGTYSGTLTVTEGARTDSTPFSVTVDNAVPAVDAGANVSGAPGSVVTFVGTATDPSSVDQASLAYTWNFGDGTPTANAAAGSTTHVYPTPGTYDATLTVCDKDGGCNVDVRRITVASQQRQPSLLVYFGDFIGRTGSNSDMRAILVDRNAHPLAGRTVTFTLGGQTVSATTDSRGVATTTLKVTAGRGLYAVSATWRPGGTDAQQYAGSSMTLPFLVLPR